MSKDKCWHGVALDLCCEDTSPPDSAYHALTERLAQVERERQEQCERADRQGLRAQKAERERDDWKRDSKERAEAAKAIAAERDEWKAKAEGAIVDRSGMARDLNHVCAERDAALAKVNDALEMEALWQGREKETCERLSTALAKAEAAEQLILEDAPLTPTGKKKLEQAEAALTDLRARIEALADEWATLRDHNEQAVMLPSTNAARVLRALIAPPKAETALDVLSRAGRALSDSIEDVYTLTPSDMAKLRKLLEEGK